MIKGCVIVTNTKGAAINDLPNGQTVADGATVDLMANTSDRYQQVMAALLQGPGVLFDYHTAGDLTLTVCRPDRRH